VLIHLWHQCGFQHGNSADITSINEMSPPFGTYINELRKMLKIRNIFLIAYHTTEYYILCRPTYIYVRVTISTSAKILGRCASFLCIFFQILHIFYTELHIHIYKSYILLNTPMWTRGMRASDDIIVPLHIYIYLYLYIIIF
jgi:hypothetical protein